MKGCPTRNFWRCIEADRSPAYFGPTMREAGFRPAQYFGAENGAAIRSTHVPDGRNFGVVLLPDQIRIAISVHVCHRYDPPAKLRIA